MEYLAHFVAATIVAILSSMGGGGGGMLITPYLLLWGIPPAVVVGSGKVGSLGVIVASTREFHKARMLNWDLAKRLAVFVAVASVIGAKIAISTEPETLRLWVGLGVLIISVGMFVFLQLGLGLEPRPTKKKHRLVGYGAYSLNTIAQSTIGAGFGMFNSIVLIAAFGQTALQALATKRLVNLVSLLAAGTVFIQQGAVNWVLVGVLAAGYYLGARLGTRVAIKKGNRFVMTLQTFLGGGMAIVLLLS